jgi:cytochrome P450
MKMEEHEMNPKKPVHDWATDYDIFDPDYVKDPLPIWRELRNRCPIAHTERWGGSWLTTRYEDLQAFVRMVPALSSQSPIVVPPPEPIDPEMDEYGIDAPPITSDPPEHLPMRRLILPFFTPKAVAVHQPYTESLCRALIDDFIDQGTCDAAAQYAQQIPPRVIAHMLGIDPSRSNEFVEWVRGVLEIGLSQPEVRIKYRRIIRQFFGELVSKRRANPGNDLISQLLDQDIDGTPLSDRAVVGMCNLLLVAGIDTTWSSIGSALWHFSTHAEHRRRLANEPNLFPSAIEELLRYYAPVTMARIATEEIQVGEVTFAPGDRVLMNFPAANHDPEVFDRPDEVVLDRERNRHIAFGIGIHRCAGSNLARMEMEVALRVWFERIPEFALFDPDSVTWAGGQVRGPRSIPVTFPV